MKKFDAMPDEESFIPEDVVDDSDVRDGDDGGSASGVNSVFPEEHIEPLRGLLFLGELSKEVEMMGHVFTMRTLREGEILRIGQLIASYSGTPVANEARKLYTVAAAVDYVDGYPLGEPYKEGYDGIYPKAQKVREWYPTVIADLYQEYLDLESTAVTVSRSLKKS